MPTPVELVLPVWLQALGVLDAWGIKPAYMLLGFWLLWRLRGQTQPEMRWLWWGLVAFEIGESACAVNYLVFDLQSVPWELVHDAGMIVAAMAITMGLLELLDRRMLFQFSSDKACALMRFCRDCPVRASSCCRFRPLFMFLCAVGALVSAAPLTREAVIDHPVAVSFFGRTIVEYHLPASQIVENRICPIVAVAFFLATLVLLWRARDPHLRWERLLFSAAVGAAFFGLFRFVNYRANFDTAVWFDFWEESTEFAAVAGLALLLHVVGDRLEPAASRPKGGE